MTYFIFSCLTAGLQAAEPKPKPIVIGHRGASGYLPEHTLEAYTLAHAQGADYVEQDLVLTRDHRLICLHDIHLERTTDVEERFPNRKRNDGRWYAIDFTLPEIKSLTVHERLGTRFPQETAFSKVPTFEEAIQLVNGLNRTTGRRVGIYPELKNPGFHRKEGKPMEPIFVRTLRESGYQSADDLIYVQCFEIDCLVRLRSEFQLPHPLIYLLGVEEGKRELFDEARLKDLGKLVQGFGPSKTLLHQYPDLASRLHRFGFLIHPYTLRSDAPYPNDHHSSFKGELKALLSDQQVDGVFTDFPDQVRHFVDSVAVP